MIEMSQNDSVADFGIPFLDTWSSLLKYKMSKGLPCVFSTSSHVPDKTF